MGWGSLEGFCQNLSQNHFELPKENIAATIDISFSAGFLVEEAKEGMPLVLLLGWVLLLHTCRQNSGPTMKLHGHAIKFNDFTQ